MTQTATIASKARMSNDQRHELLRYLITYNAAQYGRGDGQIRIAKDASVTLAFTVKASAVKRNLAFLQAIWAVPFQLRKRATIRGNVKLIGRSWGRIDDFIRTTMSGRVIAELWTLRTAQRFLKAIHGVRIALEPLASSLTVHGYRIPDNDPDAWIIVVDGAPR